MFPGNLPFIRTITSRGKARLEQLDTSTTCTAIGTMDCKFFMNYLGRGGGQTNSENCF